MSIDYAYGMCPLLRGVHLTAWELTKDTILFWLIVVWAAGCLMVNKKVNVVLDDADHIAQGDDIVSKIGTYFLAVLAHRYGIPFHMVAPPFFTIDMSVRSGGRIPIEKRDAAKITSPFELEVVPARAQASWDSTINVTTSESIMSLIAENGGRLPY